MKPIFTWFRFLIFSLIFIACTRDHYEYFVNTVDDISQNESGTVFIGEIITDHIEGITEFGFILSIAEDFSEPEQISISEGIINGINTIECELTFVYGITYYLKAYIIAGSNIVYGDIIAFTGITTPEIMVTDISPDEGTWRDSVIITGVNFNSVINPVQKLYIDNKEIPFRIVNDSVIKTSVPDDLFTMESPILIYTLFDTIPFNGKFRLLPPVINDFTPLYGERGTPIIINGKNFHPAKNFNSIKTGTYDLEVSYAEGNRLKSVIPQTMTIEGSYKIIVTSGNQNTESDVSYTHIEAWSPNGEGQFSVEHGTGHDEMYFMIGPKCYYAYFNHFERRLGKYSNSIVEINPVDRSSTNIVWYLDDFRPSISVFIDNDNIYLIRGSIICYVNPVGHDLIPKASFPDPSLTISGLRIQNKGFVKTSNNQIWQYHPETDTWIQKLNVPQGTLTRLMNIGTNCYIMFRLPDNSQDFYKFDVQNDQLYLIGQYPEIDEQMNEIASGSWLGYNSSGYSLINQYKNGILQQFIYKYNPDSDIWEKRAGPYNVNVSTGGLIYSYDNNLYAKYSTWLDGSTLKFYYWKYNLDKTIP